MWYTCVHNTHVIMCIIICDIHIIFAHNMWYTHDFCMFALCTKITWYVFICMYLYVMCSLTLTCDIHIVIVCLHYAQRSHDMYWYVLICVYLCVMCTRTLTCDVHIVNVYLHYAQRSHDMYWYVFICIDMCVFMCDVYTYTDMWCTNRHCIFALYTKITWYVLICIYM